MNEKTYIDHREKTQATVESVQAAEPLKAETRNWLKAREELNDLFIGTHKGKVTKRKKPQTFDRGEYNHGWYGSKGVKDRDNRRQSTIEDWEDDAFSVDNPIESIETLESSDEDYDKDFDWEAFNAEKDSRSSVNEEPQLPVDERDTQEFRDTDQWMRHNAPRSTPRVRTIR